MSGASLASVDKAARARAKGQMARSPGAGMRCRSGGTCRSSSSKKVKAFRLNNPNYLESEAWKNLEVFKGKLEAFGKGQVGRKRPDLVEVFIDRGTVEVTDPTQEFGQEFHEFKTRLYKEILDDLFPTLRRAVSNTAGLVDKKVSDEMRPA